MSSLILICLILGGGVRGLLTIQMLIELEKQLNAPITKYFDWIGGTSTGSIIAMLLSLGMRPQEIGETYYKFKDKILIGSKPYSSDKFEAFLKEFVGTNTKMSDLHTKYKKKLIIAGTLVDRIPAQLHMFRSYESAAEICGIRDEPPGFDPLPNNKEQLAWRACRASGAAPTYFSGE